ncbi:hypothetical protein CA234_16330 [Sphingomonas sp. ABOLE]|uniref:hypothetical protein n=1 Tax=Sphingomonas sp. ABOLE TaxID=1985878 RepID=UPI000F7D6F57|nr:hypothetical protein [Sphingomonas sp. ABOLE]RSV38033.1 hypothetical protein CA234_16330 [Sphingomonas sp. ABOLE]
MLLFFALALLAPVQAEAVPDPLAPAKAGRIRCIDPDRSARTCGTIVHYTLRGDGAFDALVTGVVNRDPLIVLEYATFGQVRDGMVCSRIRPADFNSGKLTSNGTALSPALEANTRLKLMEALQPLAGHERCYRDAGAGELTVNVTIDGLLRPEMSQTAIWVLPEDGYAPGR